MKYSIATKLGILALLICLSLPLAAESKLVYMGMSALLPGSGELARGYSSRGVLLLASDLLAISAYLKTGSVIKEQERTFQDYALHYAVNDPLYPKPYYQAMQNYYSSDEYNEFQEMLARNYFLIYNNDPEGYEAYMATHYFSEEESWRWESQKHWEAYKNLRRKHQKSQINHTMALGIMLFNRAVSVLDNAILKGPGQLQATPFGKDGISLGYEINF
ncbi:MAG: hypothetical protein WCY84_00695 [Candidatus Cloacimonadaceae bacterium]